jgi:putative nucleotidyltransferase with HDIG domain
VLAVYSVLIANSNEAEIDKIRKAIDASYDTFAITSPEEFDNHLEKYNLIILDCNFTDNSGIDFLMDVVCKVSLPVLMLTPPEDPHCAIEATRAGAFNYLVKTNNYYDFLNHSIKESIDRFKEREEMKQTIIDLKSRVSDLEIRLKVHEGEVYKNSSNDDVSYNGKKKEVLKEIIYRLKSGQINLPSYPHVSMKFKKMINENAPINKITDLLKQDAGISSKLISVSNSPYYGGYVENKTLEQAISRLGMKMTKNYVELISNHSLYINNNKKYNSILENLWKHAVSCAHASQIISDILQIRMQDEIFTMALLHDIGKLLLLQIFSDLESKEVFSNDIGNKELYEVMNTYHGIFGRNLLHRWKFSNEYARIAMHHHNLEEADVISKELLVVHFANLLVNTMGYNYENTENIDLNDVDSAKFLKLTSQMISKVENEVRKIMEECSVVSF